MHRICFCLLVMLAIGCRQSEDTPADRSQAAAPPASSVGEDASRSESGHKSAEEEPLQTEELLPGGPSEEDYPRLHNLLKITDRIYSGAEPQGREAFADLAKLGVEAVVSVDGARPQIEAAEKAGLRYVHIPIGYDGVDEQPGQALARLMREVDGPVYIHCHHGRHRGPAAAAVACIAAGEADGPAALEILRRAGTSKKYAGLWRDVENYAPPPADAELPELVTEAKVDSLAAAMAKLDRAFDRLVLCRDAGWKTPPDHPDLVPVLEALILKQGMREAQESLPADAEAELTDWVKEAIPTADRLHETLTSGDTTAAAGGLIAVEQSCDRCHAKYRNQP